MENVKRKASDAHMRATAKWEKANYFKTQVRFQKNNEDAIRDYVTKNNLTLNGFITECVLERINGRTTEQAENNITVPEDIVTLIKKAYGENTNIQEHAIELIENDLEEIFIHGLEQEKNKITMNNKSAGSDDGELPDFMK